MRSSSSSLGAGAAEAPVDAHERPGHDEAGELLVERVALGDLGVVEHALEQLAHGVDREELAVVGVEHVRELDRHVAEGLRAVRRGHEHVARRDAAGLAQDGGGVLEVLEHLEEHDRVEAVVGGRQAPAVVDLRVDAQPPRDLDVLRDDVDPLAGEAAVGQRLAVAAQPAPDVEDAAARPLGGEGHQRGVDLRHRVHAAVPRLRVAQAARHPAGQALLGHRTLPRTTSRLCGLMA